MFSYKSKKYFDMENRIYMSVSSEGLGHSSRAIAIAKEFSEEEILIGTYNRALRRVERTQIPTVNLSQELKLIGEMGIFDVKKTILKNRKWGLTFNQMVNEEIKIIRENKASCIVADGRLVPVMAAAKLGLPCIVITNQSAFYPFFERDSRLIRIFGKSFDWVMKTWLSSAEEILIPDFPPPYTICLPNLSKKNKVKKRTRFVGPLVAWDRDDIVAVEKLDSKKLYIVVTLGGHLYRKPIFDNIVEIAQNFPDIDFDIFTTFSSECLPENVRVRRTKDNIAPYLKASDLVITQAGHSTAMEILTLGKPSIIIPDNKQIEQENNASIMKEMEVSSVVAYNELTKEKMTKVIESMLSETKYRNNAEKFAELAKNINGRKKAAEVIREYSNRMFLY